MFPYQLLLPITHHHGEPTIWFYISNAIDSSPQLTYRIGNLYLDRLPSAFQHAQKHFTFRLLWLSAKYGFALLIRFNNLSLTLRQKFFL